NPTGVRCDLYDSVVNIYGRNPATGAANRMLGNAGIQYGLKALLDGAISGDQFLDLNQRIGGLDTDGNVVTARQPADPAAIYTAYRTGRVNEGQGGLSDVPIIDDRGWADNDPLNPHTAIWSVAT